MYVYRIISQIMLTKNTELIDLMCNVLIMHIKVTEQF